MFQSFLRNLCGAGLVCGVMLLASGCPTAGGGGEGEGDAMMDDGDGMGGDEMMDGEDGTGGGEGDDGMAGGEDMGADGMEGDMGTDGMEGGEGMGGGDAAAGEATFNDNCMVCHGDPTEDGPVGPAIAGESAEAIEAHATGVEPHPQTFPDLGEQDFADLETYLASV